MKRTIRTEFPEFPADLPEVSVLLSLGFADQSWHNDAAARFVHPASGLVVWLEHPDVTSRESEFAPRYCVQENADSPLLKYAGEDWSQVHACLDLPF